MKYKNLFFLIIIIVFCTERLQQIFYFAFFDFYPARVLFLLLISFFNYREFKKHSSKEVFSIFKVIIAYIFIVLISTLNSPNFFYSFKKWLDILTVFFFMFIIYGFLQKSSRNIQIEKLHNFFIRYFKIVILISFLGGLFLIRQIGDGGTLRTIAGISIFRRIGLFVDANFFCTFLIIAFSIIYFSKTNNKLFYLVIILFSIFLTGSKGGILSLSLVLIFYYRKKIPLLKSKLFPVLGIFIIILSLLFAIYRPNQTIKGITSLSIFNDERGDGTILPRIITWSSGLKQFAKSPILGIGPGNIVNVSKGSRNLNLLNYVESSGFYGLDYEAIDKLATHSNYFEILFEQGIIAFTLYLIFIYKVLKLCRNSLKLDKNIFLGYYISFSTFFLSTLLLSYNPYYISFLFGLFFFIYDKKVKETSLKRINKPLFINNNS